MRENTDSALLSAFVAVASELELAATLRRIVTAAVDLTDASYGALGVLGPEGVVVEFVHVGMDPHVAASLGHFPQGRGILGLLIDNPVPLRLEDLTLHPASVGFPPGHPAMVTFLGVPVSVRGEAFGNLYLTEKSQGRLFSESDEQAVLALAAAAAVAIENARLYETSRRREAWQQAVADIATSVLSSQDGEDILPLIAARARAITGAAVCVVALEDARGMLIAEIVDEQDPDDHTTSGSRQALGSGWIGREIPQGSIMDKAMRTGRAVHQHHTETDIDRPREFGTSLAVPMLNDGASMAVVGLFWDQDTAAPDPQVLGLAESFAAQAAVTLILARAQREHRQLALYEDRDRIARDLHDLVIQRLFATGMLLQSADRLGPVTPGVAERISAAVDELDETIREIRHTIFALHEPLSGVASGARELVRRETLQFAALLGFEPSVRFSGPVDSGLSDRIAEHLLAALREALSNAVKHAQARHIDVVVEVDTSWVRLLVTDDGVGVDAEGPWRRSGVANLVARAQSLSGSCLIERVSEQGGTRVTWRVPVEVDPAV